MRIRAGGFTLIEVMIASAIAIVVLVGALAAGVQLQRRAVFEEQAMGAQESGRAVKELLNSALVRAGVGLGSARINVGGVAGVSDFRYAITVGTDAPFTVDGTFALPPAPYAALKSDSIDIYSGDPAFMISLADCGGGPFRQAQGNHLCTVTDATAFNGSRLIVTNSALGVSCYDKVTNVSGPGNTNIQVEDGLANNSPPVGDGCEKGSNGFWNIAGALAMVSRGASFRVNWFSGSPVLEYDADGVDDPTTGWVPVSREVERIKVRMGVATLGAPAAPLVWFPDTAAAHPAIDACTNGTCLALIPGGTTAADLLPADPLQAKDALMRRVRLIEVEITMRSVRRDPETARPLGATFVTDAEGFLEDGYRRRTFSLGLAPRNLAIAGVKN